MSINRRKSANHETMEQTDHYAYQFQVPNKEKLLPGKIVDDKDKPELLLGEEAKDETENDGAAVENHGPPR